MRSSSALALVVFGGVLAVTFVRSGRVPPVSLRAAVVTLDSVFCAAIIAFSGGLNGPFWAAFLLVVVFAVDISDRRLVFGFALLLLGLFLGAAQIGGPLTSDDAPIASRGEHPADQRRARRAGRSARRCAPARWPGSTSRCSSRCR